MRIKILAEDRYIVSAIMDGDECQVEQSLCSPNAEFEAYSDGLLDMLERTAKSGWEQFSSKQVHFIDEKHKIYEFVRGRLRLIFFHGENSLLVVCTEVIVKKTQKADKKVVNRAIQAQKAYWKSVEDNCLTIIRDEDEDENE